MARARSVEADEIRQAAACQVIAQYLYDTGDYPETDQKLPRRLKDRVSDALGGVRLTRETLDWFAGAFDLSPHDSQRVYDIHRGDTEPVTITGTLPPPDFGSGIRPGHRTALLFEHHFVGRDGIPLHHHTQQTIYALATDELASYQYRIDTPEAEVRVKRGGTAGQDYPIGHGYYAIDITFPRPLRYGQTQYLDYWTNFHYSTAPPPEFRRGTHQRVEHLDMRVEFHREMQPRQVWWAEWGDYRDADRGNSRSPAGGSRRRAFSSQIPGSHRAYGRRLLLAVVKYRSLTQAGRRASHSIRQSSPAPVGQTAHWHNWCTGNPN